MPVSFFFYSAEFKLGMPSCLTSVTRNSSYDRTFDRRQLEFETSFVSTVASFVSRACCYLTARYPTPKVPVFLCAPNSASRMSTQRTSTSGFRRYSAAGGVSAVSCKSPAEVSDDELKSRSALPAIPDYLQGGRFRIAHPTQRSHISTPQAHASNLWSLASSKEVPSPNREKKRVMTRQSRQPVK